MPDMMLVVMAADLRRRAEQTEPPFSTTQIICTCFENTAVTGRELPPGIDEAVSRTSDGPIIVYRRGMPTSEQRFAIAHALAHLLFDGDEDACAVGCAGTAACEARADLFAAELLVPLEHLASYVGRGPSDDPSEHEAYLDQVDQIASHFHAPASVIDERIRELLSLAA